MNFLTRKTSTHVHNTHKVDPVQTISPTSLIDVEMTIKTDKKIFNDSLLFRTVTIILKQIKRKLKTIKNKIRKSLTQ